MDCMCARAHFCVRVCGVFFFVTRHFSFALSAGTRVSVFVRTFCACEKAKCFRSFSPSTCAHTHTYWYMVTQFFSSSSTYLWHNTPQLIINHTNIQYRNCNVINKNRKRLMHMNLKKKMLPFSPMIKGAIIRFHFCFFFYFARVLPTLFTMEYRKIFGIVA